MNRRDYRAHVEWADTVREANTRHTNRHAARPALLRPTRAPMRWRAMLAALVGSVS